MKIITERMVERHLTLPACIDAMREAMISVSSREATLPIRQFMPIPDAPGKLALMPGTTMRPGRCFGIKLVCKYERAPDSAFGTHVGMVLVFDSDQGIPLAMIEGASLTAIRTSAASALATDLLANPRSDVLAVLGNGEQALRHVRAMLAVRRPHEIRIWGRDNDRARTFADRVEREIGQTVIVASTVKEAVSDADLICTTTAATRPILEGEWLAPGTHVNLVGAAIPTSAEADEALVARSRFFVDYRPAAMAAAGELIDAIKTGRITQAHIAGEIGEVAAGSCKGRLSPEDITVYKSLGVAAQDLAAGYKLYQAACAEGFGLDVEMMDYQDRG